MVRFAKLCEYTKRNQTIQFKWVNCMAYELNLNKFLFKKKKSRLVICKCHLINYYTISASKECAISWRYEVYKLKYTKLHSNVL